MVSLDAAKVFAIAGTLLIGNESQTFGPEDAPMEVHLALLAAEVVLLEDERISKAEMAMRIGKSERTIQRILSQAN